MLKRLEVVIAGTNKGFKDAADDTARSTDSLGDKLKSALGGAPAVVGAAAVGALAGIGMALKGAYDAAAESAKITRETERVIRSTGGAANVTAGQVGELAGSISDLTGIDDEAVQSVENLMLTFTGVKNVVGEGNDIFTQSIMLTEDMATVLGTDASGAAVQLGKALNDPIKGITALSKAGVSFSAEQKEHIKTMVEAGDTLGAQKIILAELTKEFGGAAEAAATPLDKLRVKVGNVQEAIGAGLIPIVDAAATFIGDRLPGAFEAATGFISEHADAIGNLATVALVGLAASYAPVIAAQAALVVTNVAGFFTNIAATAVLAGQAFMTVAAQQGIMVAATQALTFAFPPALVGLVAIGLLLHGFAVAGQEGAKAAEAFSASLDVVPTNLASLRDGIAQASDKMDELGQRGSTAGDRLMGIVDVVVPFHDVTNSVEDARGEFERLGGDTEKWQHTLDLSAGTIDQVIGKLQGQATAAGEMTLSGEALRAKLEEIAAVKQIDLTAPGSQQALMDLYQGTLAATPAAQGLASAFGAMGSAATTADDTLKALKAEMDAMFGVHIAAAQAANSFGASLDGVAAKVTGGAVLTDAYNAKNREASGAVLSAADSAIKHAVSLYEEGAGLGAATDALAANRQHLIDTMVATGMSEAAATSYIATLHLTPDNILTIANLNKDAAEAAAHHYDGVVNNAARPRTGTMYLDVSSALGALGSVEAKLNYVGSLARSGNLAASGYALGRTLAGNAEGGITLHQFAEGGHIAQIAQPGVMRLWNEPETGGEAYIPLGGAKRVRSTAILAEVANMFGFKLSTNARGGVHGGGTSGATTVIENHFHLDGGFVGDEEGLARVIGRTLQAGKRSGQSMPWDR